MDKTVVLGALKDLVSLFLGDESVCTGLSHVNGVVIEVHAHIVFNVAAALAHQTACTAA